MMLVLRRGRTLTVRAGVRPLPLQLVEEQGLAANIRASFSIPNPSDLVLVPLVDESVVHHS